MIYRECTFPADSATRPFAIILHDECGSAFATHFECRDELGGRHWGHYFSTYKEAEADWKERVRKNL
jgi:hypothetical protein